MTILFGTMCALFVVSWNEVRIGKLLEDLDALAGTIAFKVYLSFSSCASSFNWITHVKLKA